MPLKCCNSTGQQIWENSAMATGLKKVNFHSNPKEGQCQKMFKLLKNCSFHVLARLCSKSFKLDFNSMWMENFQMYKLGFEEAEEPQIKLATLVGWWRMQGSSRKTSTSASLSKLNLSLYASQQTGKFLKRQKYHTTLPVSWETWMWIKK